MKRAHLSLELVEFRSRGFGKEQDFRLPLDLSFPAINRFHLRQYLNTRCEVRANQHFREPRSFFAVGGSHEDHNGITVRHLLLRFFCFSFIFLD